MHKLTIVLVVVLTVTGLLTQPATAAPQQPAIAGSGGTGEMAVCVVAIVMVVICLICFGGDGKRNREANDIRRQDLNTNITAIDQEILHLTQTAKAEGNGTEVYTPARNACNEARRLLLNGYLDRAERCLARAYELLEDATPPPLDANYQ